MSENSGIDRTQACFRDALIIYAVTIVVAYKEAAAFTNQSHKAVRQNTDQGSRTRNLKMTNRVISNLK